MSDISLPIIERLLSVVPTGSPGISGLLRVVDIIEDSTVPTAQIDCQSPPYIRINPTFVEQYCPTPERMTMLVMHELFHLILGHTRLFPRVTDIDNIVFDAVINSMLCRMYPEDVFTSFFSGYYADSVFPDCLLRPPAGWKPTEIPDDVPVPPALLAEHMSYPADVYQALYSTGCTEDALRSLFEIPAVLQEVGEGGLADVCLLGDHRNEDDDASSGGELERRSPGLLETVKAVVERWPQPPDPIAGTSLEALLHMHDVEVRLVPPQQKLEWLLRKIGNPAFNSSRRRAMVDTWATVPTVRTRLDRRGFVAEALGQPWLLGSAVLPLRRLSRDAGVRTHLYLDVSGSVADILPLLIGAVKRHRSMLHPMVHMFSTSVVDVSIDALIRGKVRTGWGTSVECVASHMRTHRVQRAVLVTDGHVGPFGASARQVLEDAVLGVALVGDVRTDRLLKSVADSIVEVNLKGSSK